MKRLLLLFLLFVVPLQYSWAAAAAYCTHEDRQGGHFGHHVHVHHAETGATAESANAGAVGDDGGADKKPAKPHHDCSVCQFSTQAGLPASMPGLVPAQAVLHDAAGSFTYTSHIPDHPSVPGWLLRA